MRGVRVDRDERGAILVLSVLALGVVFGFAALVIDLGQLRFDRRANKAATDVAARAGVGRVQFGPWSGVCKARDFLLANVRGFSTFDPGSETWTNAAVPPAVFGTTPCASVATAPDAVPCSPNAPSTWARLQATAGGGRYTIEIQSGYALPDARFEEDLGRADAGEAEQGSCDNLAVILTQNRPSFFAGVMGFDEGTTRVRSVARLNATETLDFLAALHLLERSECGVLQTGGSNTRVVVHPDGTQPGTIQIDSAASAASCPQPVLNSQSTSGGPSVVACSAQSANLVCRPGTGNRPSRIGIYALNFNRPPVYITNGYPATYGDTKAVATPRTGRRFADQRYRANVAGLDAEAKSVLNGSLPPGCGPVVGGTCTGTDGVWRVVTDCSTTNLTALAPALATAPRVWFGCDLTVSAPLLLSGPDSYIVVKGALRVSSTFTITDARRFYVLGRATGNKIGVDLTSGGTLTVNSPLGTPCLLRTGAGIANRMVVGHGSLKVASGSFLRLCQTAVLMASGFDKVPTVDGTLPCTSPCSGYSGVVDVTAGGETDWSAPNQITNRVPEPWEIATTHKFEDLALWTEAGGNTNGISGGAAMSMTGVFFLPNAHTFNLAGGGALPIELAAQFISRSLKVTGGATIHLVPKREDSLTVLVYSTLLVR